MAQIKTLQIDKRIYTLLEVEPDLYVPVKAEPDELTPENTAQFIREIRSEHQPLPDGSYRMTLRFHGGDLDLRGARTIREI